MLFWHIIVLNSGVIAAYVRFRPIADIRDSDPLLIAGSSRFRLLAREPLEPSVVCASRALDEFGRSK